MDDALFFILHNKSYVITGSQSIFFAEFLPTTTQITLIGTSVRPTNFAVPELRLAICQRVAFASLDQTFFYKFGIQILHSNKTCQAIINMNKIIKT